MGVFLAFFAKQLKFSTRCNQCQKTFTRHHHRVASEKFVIASASPAALCCAGIKESVCWTPPPEVNPNKTCEYQALCSRFKDLLTLPGEFHRTFTHLTLLSPPLHPPNCDCHLFPIRRLLQRRHQVQPVLLRVLPQAPRRWGVLQERRAAPRLRPALWMVLLRPQVRSLPHWWNMTCKHWHSCPRVCVHCWNSHC